MITDLSRLKRVQRSPQILRIALWSTLQRHLEGVSKKDWHIMLTQKILTDQKIQRCLG